MPDTFKDFDEQFPDDAACLEFIFKARYTGHTCGLFGVHFNLPVVRDRLLIV